MTRRGAAIAPVAAPAKRGSVGLVVGLMVALIAAAAGVAYFVYGTPQL